MHPYVHTRVRQFAAKQIHTCTPTQRMSVLKTKTRWWWQRRQQRRTENYKVQSKLYKNILCIMSLKAIISSSHRFKVYILYTIIITSPFFFMACILSFSLALDMNKKLLCSRAIRVYTYKYMELDLICAKCVFLHFIIIIIIITATVYIINISREHIRDYVLLEASNLWTYCKQHIEETCCIYVFHSSCIHTSIHMDGAITKGFKGVQRE